MGNNVWRKFGDARLIAVRRVGEILFFANVINIVRMVGAVRFELTTSCTRNKRATGLRYAPNRDKAGVRYIVTKAGTHSKPICKRHAKFHAVRPTRIPPGAGHLDASSGAPGRSGPPAPAFVSAPLSILRGQRF
jgi:hypothetical protein